MATKVRTSLARKLNLQNTEISDAFGRGKRCAIGSLGRLPLIISSMHARCNIESQMTLQWWVVFIYLGIPIASFQRILYIRPHVQGMGGQSETHFSNWIAGLVSHGVHVAAADHYSIFETSVDAHQLRRMRLWSRAQLN